jgi:hypothetical protein
MWTSVPQIVVSVIRMSASPGPGRGLATSSMSYSPGARNTFARIVSIAIIAILLSERRRSPGAESVDRRVRNPSPGTSVAGRRPRG